MRPRILVRLHKRAIFIKMDLSVAFVQLEFKMVM